MKAVGILDGTLLECLTSTDSDEVMPPEGGPLYAEQIAAIKSWIDAGRTGDRG